jgi:hypothetical protein
VATDVRYWHQADFACFIARDHGGQALAYVYFEDERGGDRPRNNAGCNLLFCMEARTEKTMRNLILTIAIAFALTAPGSAFAGDKNKSKGIEVQDYGFGISAPVTTSRSDGAKQQTVSPVNPNRPKYDLKGSKGSR